MAIVMHIFSHWPRAFSVSEGPVPFQLSVVVVYIVNDTLPIRKEGRETELNATETKTEFLSSGVIYLKSTKGGWDWGLINVIRPSVFANWCLLKLVSYPLT